MVYSAQELDIAKQMGHNPEDIYGTREKMNDEGSKGNTERTAMYDGSTENGAQKIENWRNKLISKIEAYMATQSKKIVLDQLTIMLDAIRNADTVREMNEIWMRSKQRIPLNDNEQKKFNSEVKRIAMADATYDDSELDAMLSAELGGLDEPKGGTSINPLAESSLDDTLPPIEGEATVEIDAETKDANSDIDKMIEDLQAVLDNKELELDGRGQERS